MGLRAILDQPHICADHLPQPVHIAGPACKMHAQHRLCVRPQMRRNRLGRDVLVHRIHIRKDRPRAGIDDRRDRGEKAARGDDHLIGGRPAIDRPDPEPMQRQIQRHRAIGHGNPVGASGEGGKFLLELPPLLTGPVIDLVGQQDARHRIGFFLGKAGPGRKGSVEHIIFPEVSRAFRPWLRLREHFLSPAHGRR